MRVCSGVTGYPGVAALCTWTNTGEQERLSYDEWLDFLYAQPERPDPKNPKKKLPAKGPAMSVSSEDYQKNDSALAQLCVKANCTYEQKKALERVKELPAQAQSLKPKGNK